MNVISKIELLKPKKLVGCKVLTSLSNNQTCQAWSSFMPGRKAIIFDVGMHLCSSKRKWFR